MEQGALQLPVSGDSILTAPRLMTAWGPAGEKGEKARRRISLLLVPLACCVTYPTVEKRAVTYCNISHPLSREAGFDIQGSFKISSADLGPESGIMVEAEEQ